MPTIRRLLLTHRLFAALLCAAVLALRLVVPAGYMLGEQQGRVAIVACPGAMPAPAVHAAMSDHHRHDAPAGHDHMGDGACAFAGLSAPMLGAVDVALLLVALALVAMAARRGALPAPPRVAPRLRPPLRGPPLPT